MPLYVCKCLGNEILKASMSLITADCIQIMAISEIQTFSEFSLHQRHQSKSSMERDSRSVFKN